MPGSTPVYGITYPCGGDTINSAVFATFANTMNAALAQGTAELAAVTGRPNAQILGFLPAQDAAVNVVTTMTYDTEVYDNDAMADVVANNDRLTIQTSGAYLIGARFSAGSTTTMTSAAIILTVNAVERGRFKKRPRSSDTFASVDLTMPMNLVAGDVVRAQALWTGTGGPSPLTIRMLSASYLTAP